MSDAVGPSAATPRRGRLPGAFWVSVLTYVAASMNMVVASIAAPTISVDLQATPAELAWLVNATPLSAAAVLLLAGTWGDRIGTVRLLRLGLGLFVISVALSCVVAVLPALIALRAVTGVASALAMPAAVALVFQVVPEGSRRTAIGVLGAVQAGALLLAPIAAGAVLVVAPWGAAFAIVLPFGLAALVLSARLRAEVVPGREPADTVGAVLAAVVTVGVMYALLDLTPGEGGSSPLGLAALTLAGVALVALVPWERSRTNPIFLGSALRSRRFWLPTMVIVGVHLVLGGLLFAGTQYLQLAVGMTAFTAGLFLTPALLTWAVSAGTVGVLARRLGLRPLLATGLTMAAGGAALLAAGGTQPAYPLLVTALLLLGLMGVAPAAMTHLAVGSYPERRRTVGSAINSAATRYGSAFGVAAFSTVIGAVFIARLPAAADGTVPVDVDSTSATLGGALAVAARLPGPAGDGLSTAAREAFTAGFSLTLAATSVLLVLLAIATAVLLPREPSDDAQISR